MKSDVKIEVWLGEQILNNSTSETVRCHLIDMIKFDESDSIARQLNTWSQDSCQENKLIIYTSSEVIYWDH